MLGLVPYGTPGVPTNQFGAEPILITAPAGPPDMPIDIPFVAPSTTDIAALMRATPLPPPSGVNLPAVQTLPAMTTVGARSPNYLPWLLGAALVYALVTNR